jgi:hypothetical protein
MPTQHPRVQVTKDPELAEALRAAAPHLRAGLPLSQQIRELAIIGSRHLQELPLDDDEVQRRLEKLADMFMEPETAFWDWDSLRDKANAWPIR